MLFVVCNKLDDFECKQARDKMHLTSLLEQFYQLNNNPLFRMKPDRIFNKNPAELFLHRK